MAIPSLGKKMFVLVLGTVFLLALSELVLWAGNKWFLISQSWNARKAVVSKDLYTILCLGDSMTALGGDESYPALLRTVLKKKYPGSDFNVVNGGVVGATTGYILGHLSANIGKYGPDMIIVMAGINDVRIRYFGEAGGAFRRFLGGFRVYRFISTVSARLATRFPDLSFAGAIKSKEGYGDLFESLIQRGDFRGGLSLSLARIKKDPDCAEAYFNAAFIYRVIGRYDSALEMLEKVMKSYPDNAAAYAHMGEYYLLIGSTDENLAKAHYYFSRARELDPGLGKVYLGLGSIARDRKNVLLAVEHFNKAVSLGKPDPMSHYILGLCYIDAGDLRKAKEHCLKAYGLDPFNDLIIGALRTVLKSTGDDPARRRLDALTRNYLDNYVTPETKSNFLEMHRKLQAEKIGLVLVQYPMRSIAPLRKIFAGPDPAGIVFVDNGNSFMKACAEKGHKALFLDLFAGDFGHCTAAGNMMIAVNIVEALDKEMFR